MREIPELQIICLRSVGSHACSAEDTFATLKNGEPSRASRLLRSFHDRSVLHLPNDDDEISTDASKQEDSPDDTFNTFSRIPLARKPCIGHGSARRVNSNDVDLNHPMIACRMSIQDGSGRQKYQLVMQYGSPALDCLQSYIDSLVELGRMDDTRLGIHFFEEWKANVLLQSNYDASSIEPDLTLEPVSKKRRRGSDKIQNPTPDTTVVAAYGSLSLHNCTLSSETIEAMVKSGMGPYLAVLDLTGVHGITDDVSAMLFAPSVCVNLKRLSLKNCRKISGKSIRLLPTACGNSLECLDIGGCFNISASSDVLEVIGSLPKLSELHASGLQWNDEMVSTLISRIESPQPKRKGTLSPWQGLSLGFSIHLTQSSLRESLMLIADTLQSLALPFCETVVDNALLGVLGRNLPCLKYLDLRGNPSLNTLTGWYDGRVSADLSTAQELTVLGRYTSVTETSVEETRRVHPLAANSLVVVLDGSGMGAGIAREYI